MSPENFWFEDIVYEGYGTSRIEERLAGEGVDADESRGPVGCGWIGRAKSGEDRPEIRDAVGKGVPSVILPTSVSYTHLTLPTIYSV